MHKEQDLTETIKCYSYFNVELSDITLKEAQKHANQGEMILYSKGRGRNRRYTSCRWISPRASGWKRKYSAGYIVRQLEI
jgi:hypothetical protein